LLLDLSQGLLLIHLGMSGSLRFAPSLPAAGAHDHMDLQTDKGVLRLHDPRRFGAVVYAPSGEDDSVAQKLLGNLGIEPFSAAFTAAALHQGLRGKTASIKQVLLAGRVVVGVGNIYASEALFLAGIRPQTAAGRISLMRAARLHAAIVQVLQQAVDLGGSSLKDFSNADGKLGYFALNAAVYGRSGQACRQCGGGIVQFVQGQRTSFYCPHCQR
jgi:formamidopyrimidine-DNA glycosylase